MTQIDSVAEYVRKMGRESSSPVSADEIAEALGITKAAVADARTKLGRRENDIFPCAPSMMVYEPDWKEKHPDIWAQAQERTRLVREGQIRAAQKRSGPLPNVMGPVITLHNVVAINVHPDHVSVQHVDGRRTDFTGTLKMKGKSNG